MQTPNNLVSLTFKADGTPRSKKPALVVRRRGKRADPEKLLDFVVACEMGASNLESALDLAAGTGRWMRKEDVEVLKQAQAICEREAALNSPVEEVAS